MGANYHVVRTAGLWKPKIPKPFATANKIYFTFFRFFTAMKLLFGFILFFCFQFSLGQNFYLNLKGNIEKAIIDLSFDTTVIYRPSLLLGKRNEKRPMERLGRILAPLFDAFTFGGPYHSVHAKLLASKMLERTKRPTQGVSFAYYPDF